MIKLAYQRTLIYYDLPQLFIASDVLGVQYICLLVDDSSELVYCCVPLSKIRLRLLLTNQIDLLNVFLEREVNEWYWLSTNDIYGSDLLLELGVGIIPERYLPDSGLYVSPSIEGEELLISAIERAKLLSEVSVEPPESVSHVISAKTLSLLLDAYQSVVRWGFAAIKKKSQRLGNKISVAVSDAHILDVYGFAPGSFKIRFEARSGLDLLGDSDVERVFELIESILSRESDPEAVAKILEGYKGHFVTSLIRLLKVVEENKSYFSLCWAKPTHASVRKATLSYSSVNPLLAILSTKEEMLVEEITLTGILKKADVDSGSWRLKSDDNDKEYSGTLYNSKESLSGLKLDARYSVLCAEKVEDMPFTGKEITTLQAIHFTAL